ncbi:unnamed protein product [Vitrella brassicaformis CCMP3155]|uniref:Uncharacterized protein n=1 Tax=Vitrella brassicaformis (strain CCMP3155) TaxID=1169540 RepID=A0A0G4H144_VITBC|nr:unnamed protein product [Vitrella brassicaformis CCMP3155]|eukprot:CEM37209.1 unnamed protein product [Vitrella brassicaformis CCMP3155]
MIERGEERARGRDREGEGLGRQVEDAAEGQGYGPRAPQFRRLGVVDQQAQAELERTRSDNAELATVKEELAGVRAQCEKFRAKAEVYQRQEALSTLGHAPAAITRPYQGMPPLQPTYTTHSAMAPQHPPMHHHPAHSSWQPQRSTRASRPLPHLTASVHFVDSRPPCEGADD